VLALTVSNSAPWVRDHFPFMAYLLATLAAAYFGGPGPGALVALSAGFATFFGFRSGGFFIGVTQTPLATAISLMILLGGSALLLGSLKRSRDHLAAERERYAALAESRDLLYRELQHRVSNNITIIAGLLHIQAGAVSDSEARRALAEAAARIGLVARIQRQLHDRSGEPTPFRLFAEELLTDAIAASGASGVSVQIEGGENPLHQDQATPVSLVLLECVNNALEHGYAAGRGGKIQVRMTETAGRAVLSITDDGCGLPAGFQLSASKSLGLRIVRTMASQLEGGFSMTPADPGVVCRLEFPLATW
jgi:two-component sensor histidine kinase